MPGGTLQLTAYGPKNIYFNGNPQLTFFKTVYKRHTNFAIEPIVIYPNSKLSLGGKTSYKLNNLGDLLLDLYLECNLELTFNDPIDKILNLGHNIIKEYNIEIGGKTIDKQYGTWLQIWDELTIRNTGGSNGKFSSNYGNLFTNNQLTKGLGLQKTSENFNYTNKGGGNSYLELNDNYSINSKIFLEFPLWFSKNNGLALPLLCISDDVKFYIELNSIINPPFYLENHDGISISENEDNTHHDSYYINNFGIITTAESSLTTDNSNFKLIGHFVFLDEYEKCLIKNKDHEYLIEQVQYTNYTLDNNNNSIVSETLKLDYNYCIKELIWAFQRKNPLYYSEFISLADHNGTIKINMSNETRLNEQNVLYFTRFQPNKYHTGRGGINAPDSIFVYSFCLFPEKYEPSGSCNFSALDDDAYIIFENINLATDYDVDYQKGVDLLMFAINYNIMEIRDGQVDVLFKSTL